MNYEVIITACLGADISPENSVLYDVEVECRGLFNAAERDGHIVAVGSQRDAADVCTVGEEQERFRYDACAQVTEELQTHRTRTCEATWPVKAQVTATTIGHSAAISA